MTQVRRVRSLSLFDEVSLDSLRCVKKKVSYLTSSFAENRHFECDLCRGLKHSVIQPLNIRLGIERTKYDVVKCKNCKLLSLYPIPTEEELENIYADYLNTSNRCEVEHQRVNIYREKLRKLTQYTSGKRLLDIGAGLGTFIKCAKEFGFQAVGIEYEKEQCKNARERYNIDLIDRDVESIHKSLPRAAFDVINMNHVLEHVRSPRKLLEICYSLLSADGILLIEVPNQFHNIINEVTYYFTKKFQYPRNSLHHLYFFSISTVKKYMEVGHYEILEMNQFRPRIDKKSVCQMLPRNCYRYITSQLDIGGGSFIEIYARK